MRGQQDTFISQLCDGLTHCRDGSDEMFGQCVQVRQGGFYFLMYINIHNIVKLRQGSGKERQGKASMAKGERP